MKTTCAYDGTKDVFYDRRCKACGRKRKEAIHDAKKWDLEHKQYLLKTRQDVSS